MRHAAGDSNLGAAIVLAVALQLHGSWDEAVERMTSSAIVVSTDASIYSEGYARYRATWSNHSQENLCERCLRVTGGSLVWTRIANDEPDGR